MKTDQIPKLGIAFAVWLFPNQSEGDQLRPLRASIMVVLGLRVLPQSGRSVTSGAIEVKHLHSDH